MILHVRYECNINTPGRWWRLSQGTMTRFGFSQCTTAQPPRRSICMWPQQMTMRNADTLSHRAGSMGQRGCREWTKNGCSLLRECTNASIPVHHTLHNSCPTCRDTICRLISPHDLAAAGLRIHAANRTAHNQRNVYRPASIAAHSARTRCCCSSKHLADGRHKSNVRSVSRPWSSVLFVDLRCRELHATWPA